MSDREGQHADTFADATCDAGKLGREPSAPARPDSPSQENRGGADRTWTVLAACAKQFSAAWDRQGDPPDPGRIAPSGPPAVRRIVLTELVKIDLARRWQAHREPRLLEDYLRELPELLDRGRIPVDLIYEEFHVRKQAGQWVETADYYRRFSRQATELQRLFELGDARRTTTLVPVDPVDDLEVGSRIEDFDLLEKLGEGAFAKVYLARQRSMQRLVALKVSADRGHEPQTLAQLDHPGIVRVFDQRLVPGRQVRLLYMQYLSGGTLQDVIERASELPPSERRGRMYLEVVDRAVSRRSETPADSPARQRMASLAWPELVCRLGIQLAGALDYAHRQGVLHRDLKPANILLAADGTPKLADFNISCCTKLDGSTPAAYFGGSLAYMSPEQLQACNPQCDRKPEDLDGRSDVYALGVILWELLTGNRPFRDPSLQDDWPATLAAMVERRLAGPDPAGLKTAPQPLPPGLAEVLVTCLAPDPRDRYASAGEVARQLQLCLQPLARKLFSPGGDRLVRAARRWPLAAVALAALVPNLLAAAFNLIYNYQQIVVPLQSAGPAFRFVVAVINSVAFSIGIGLVVLVPWPVHQALAALRQGAAPPTELLRRARARCLRVGRIAAWLGTAEWLMAGVLFPLLMSLQDVHLSVGHWLHFIASMALCGLIAASYPFFAATAICVRAFYPALLRPGTVAVSDGDALAGLYRLTWFYLVLAGLMPMLGVLLLLVFGGSPNRLALGVLCGCGLAGFGLIFWLARVIQRDIDALLETIRPARAEAFAESESFSSSWWR